MVLAAAGFFTAAFLAAVVFLTGVALAVALAVVLAAGFLAALVVLGAAAFLATVFLAGAALAALAAVFLAAVALVALSGTSYMSVALLAKQFGWEYFDTLRANGARIGKGSGQVIDDTASGELVACLGVDYITIDKITKGAPLALAYPTEMLVVPSPVAIFKGTPNLSASQKFVDYLLSKEAQTIIAAEGTLPVRADVTVPAEFKLPTAEDANKRAIRINYNDIIADKEATVKRFTEALQGR